MTTQTFPPQPDAKDRIIGHLEQQRNVALTSAAVLAAERDALRAALDQANARIAELEAPKEASDGERSTA